MTINIIEMTDVIKGRSFLCKMCRGGYCKNTKALFFQEGCVGFKQCRDFVSNTKPEKQEGAGHEGKTIRIKTSDYGCGKNDLINDIECALLRIRNDNEKFMKEFPEYGEKKFKVVVKIVSENQRKGQNEQGNCNNYPSPAPGSAIA